MSQADQGSRASRASRAGAEIPNSHQAVAGGSGVHTRSCRTKALARTRSFLMTAVMATLGGFPAASSAAYFCPRTGLQRIAASGCAADLHRRTYSAFVSSQT